MCFLCAVSILCFDCFTAVLFSNVVAGVVLCMQVCNIYILLFCAVESTFIFFVSGDISCLVLSTELVLCMLGEFTEWVADSSIINSLMMYFNF